MRHFVAALALLFGLTTAQAADVTVNYQTSSGPQQVTTSFPLPVTSEAGTPFSVNIGQTGTAGDATITLGGTAQNLFSSTTPANGFSVINPNASDDCWLSDSTTAAINGKGSQRVAANGGEYVTPTAYKPVGPVSVVCPTTNDVLTARRW